MRSLLGRFHRPMSRGLVNNMLTMNNLGDGSTLDLDFTTGVLDPRLTFSRASTATFVNSSGYVEYAAHNLYYNTNFETITTGTANPSLTSKGWSYVFSTGTAVFNTDGSVSMTAVANRVGLLRSAGFAGTGRRLIFSVDITSVGDTGLPPSQLVNEGTKTNDSYYINGTLWTSGNVVGPCTVSYVFTSNPAGNASTYFGIGMSSTSTGIATFANPRWGFYGGVNQLAYSPNTSATNANYLTAEYHTPRFDYSPTNIGEPRGLLVEGQGANLVTNSISMWNWYSGGVTRTQDTTIQDIFGQTGTSNNTAKVVKASGAGSQFHTLQAAIPSVPVAANTIVDVTVSVWVKMDGVNQPKFSIGILDTSGTPSFGATFGTKSPNGQSVSNDSVTMSSYSTAECDYTFGLVTGWVRCSISRRLNNTTGSLINWTTGLVLIYPDRFTANASTIYVCGAQVEIGIGASSLIPTGASQVTRTPDLLAVTSTTTMGLNTSEGTFFVETELPRAGTTSPSQFGTPYANGSWLGQFYGSTDATTLTANWWGGSALPLLRLGNPKSLTALSYGLYTGTSIPVSSSLNGAVSTGTFTTSGANNAPNPATWSFITLACNSTSLGTTSRDNFNGCIKRFKYFPTRLTDAQLQTLTAP